MAVLIVGATEREQIVKVKAYASAHPVTIESLRSVGVANTDVLKLEDRPADFMREPVPSVTFPGGYRANYSVEQQPPGFCSHLSVSVEGRSKKGMMPSPPAVQMIAEEFGVPYPADLNMWIEEFEPGEYAVNLLSLIKATPEGTA